LFDRRAVRDRKKQRMILNSPKAGPEIVLARSPRRAVRRGERTDELAT